MRFNQSETFLLNYRHCIQGISFILVTADGIVGCHHGVYDKLALLFVLFYPQELYPM